MSLLSNVGRWARVSAVLIAAGAAASPAMSQWRSDPAQTTPVFVGPGDQGLPQLRPAPAGGIWVFYFDNAAGSGYKPTIQRLDSCGFPLFATPIVLANRTNTATFGSDLKIDSSGNAYATFDNGSIIAQKILPDGTLPWGAAGVTIPGSSGVFGSRIVGFNDGSAVVAFSVSNSATITFQRVNADGTLPATGGTWTVSEASRYHAICELQATGNPGEFIALWIRGSSLNANTSAKGLRMQKYNAANAPQWGTVAGWIDIFTSGTGRSITNGYFPTFIPDGAGGAVLAWYNGGVNVRDARVQHVLADGSQRFPAEGQVMTTTPGTTEFRLSAALAYTPPGSYTVFYQKSNTAQSQFGLGASRVEWDTATSQATLTFNAGAGIDVLPQSATTWQSSFVDAKPVGADAQATWIQYQGANGPMIIQTSRIKADGTFAWSTPVATIASTSGTKGRLAVMPLTVPGQFAAMWADGAAGSADVVAQRFTDAGTLVSTCAADFDCSGQRTVDDIFLFLSAWFAGSPRADFDGLDGRTIDDIFLFLGAWFAGCP